MPDVIRQDEVLLFGKRFPIAGGVSHTIVTPFAPKMTQGDYTRDDKIVDSTWVLSSWSGGIGTLYTDFPQDQDRYWFGDLEGRYRHLLLGPMVESADEEIGLCNTLIEHNERLYVVDAANAIFIWDEGTRALLSLSKVFDGPITAHFDWHDSLWFVTDTSLYQYVPASGTWTDYTGDVSGFPPGGVAALVWDSKVFVLGTDNVLRWTINPSDSAPSDPPDDDLDDWKLRAKLHMPPGYCRQLIVYFDQLGEAQIHAITRRGVYGYSFDADTWHQTPLVHPTTEAAGSGATVWRGELKVQAGDPIYSYNGSVIQNQSLSGQDGLPEQYRGRITKLVPGHAFYYAVMESITAGEQSIDEHFYTTSPFDHEQMTANETTGAVFVSTGASWHTMYLTPPGVDIGDVVVASVQDTFRIWISTSEGLFYIPLSRDLHNPLQNPASKFKSQGYIETGWSDMGWAELEKLGLKIELETRDCDPEHPIGVYVAWDEDDVWEHVGTATTTGSVSFPLAGDRGRVFRNFRFRFTMERGDDPAKTPVLHSAVATFHRVPEQLFGWQFDLQLTEPYQGRSPYQLQEELREILRDKRAGLFVYRADDGDLSEVWVRVSRVTGTVQAGTSRRGRINISVIQIGG